jgi:hypothetical protein
MRKALGNGASTCLYFMALRLTDEIRKTADATTRGNALRQATLVRRGP